MYCLNIPYQAEEEKNEGETRMSIENVLLLHEMTPKVRQNQTKYKLQETGHLIKILKYVSKSAEIGALSEKDFAIVQEIDEQYGDYKFMLILLAIAQEYIMDGAKLGDI
jgi:hypothetical protein